MQNDPNTSHEHVPVLIVGGGLAGLSTSLCLAHYGAQSLLVERHATTTVHPKQFGVGIRPTEIFRSLDLEQAVQAGGADLAHNREHITVQTLAAGAVSRRHFPGENSADGLASPSTLTICAQNVLEPLLLNAARQRGAEIHFGTELLSFEQDSAGVTATLLERASGERRRVYADYLVAADGARSPIRRKLDIPRRGAGTFSHMVNIYFRADFRSLVDENDLSFAVCVVMNPEAFGVLGSVNSRDLWCFNVSFAPERGEKLEDFTAERCTDLVRKALGLPDLAVEILSVLPWDVEALAAQRLVAGRVFIVGDAAHVMPPTGGFGASTGIQDAQNLAWKLALVTRGLAGPQLLSTYEDEREPVDWFTVEQARLRWQESNRRWSADASERAEVGMAHDLVVMLGYHYTSPAIVEPRTAMLSLEQLSLDGEPGTRAPHLWFERAGERISTLDLFGQRFVLLSGAQGESWLTAGKEIAARLKLDLDCYRAGSDISGVDGDLEAAYGISPRGAVLVRPDGFVAWRSEDASAQPEQVLARTFAQVLCREV